MKAVTVIGCGHGGQALAADLSQRGCQVTLYAHPKHPGGIHAIAKARGIQCKGLLKGFTPITKITTDLQTALADSEIIYISLPSYAHEAMFIELLPFIQPEQTIVTLAANFASLIYLKLLHKTHKADHIHLLDIASLPYVCRSDHAGTVEVLAIKEKVAAASIPAQAIDQYIQLLTPIFPCRIQAYPDVLSLNMNITSGMTHPVITLLNAGRIGQDKEVFYFYRDGITPEIAGMIEKLDQERIQIGQHLGLTMHRYLDLMQEYYGIRYDSIYAFFKHSPAHNQLPLCPTSLQDRYITQDVADLLVPWYSLGQLTQIHSPTLGNLINLASLLNNTDYLQTGTNLVSFNLHSCTVNEIKHYLLTGKHVSTSTDTRTLHQNTDYGYVA
jgi:opine dehydrogenase